MIENSTQSIQFMLLNLIPNHRTDKEGGRVDIMRRTHIFEKKTKDKFLYSRLDLDYPENEE